MSEFQVDLSNCEREPIHLSGAIQPHGALFVVSPDAADNLKILPLSTNTSTHFGVAPEALLDQSIGAVLDDDSVAILRAAASGRAANPLHAAARTGGRGFDAIVQLAPEGLLVELEPSASLGILAFPSFYHHARAAVMGLQSVTGVIDMCQRAAEEVRLLTGFDRVMVYRFDRHDDGHVVAEAMREGQDSYLDLHYPASDIPAQARRLYVVNRLRLIADVLYVPVPIEPAQSPVTGAPIDLSHSVLRSVSPIHVEYLQNMGINASMSISLVIDERLWGLVICHHDSARYVPYEVRAACDFLSQALSWQLAARQRADRMEERSRIDDRLRHLIQTLSQADGLEDGLGRDVPNLLALVEADGAALVHAGRTTVFGVTPNPGEIEHAVEWLRAREKIEAVFVEGLAAEVPGVVGLLAVPLGAEGESYLLWFRPESCRR